MTNPVRPPSSPATDPSAAALAATALASEGQTSHAAMAASVLAKRAAAAAAQGRPAEPMRTSAPGFTPVAPGSPHTGQSSVPTSAPSPAASAAPASSSKPDPYLGTTFDGRYQIEKRLGEGGMGVVYSAKHTMIGKRVAVKVLRNEYASDKDILERFVQEARTASSIGNPHIVDISDFGTLPDGATYFVMELLEGVSLAEVINPPGTKLGEGDRVDPTRILKIALQLCDGLGAAHARDIVHRDLKPDNIFLVKKVEPDFVKILDFGIAKVTNTATQKTRAGQVFGTPHYMSPEQASGRGVDARSDIYSVGVILYEMATGRLPFTDETYMGILTAHMYRSPEPIRAIPGLENFPVGLDAIIQKCLAKHLELRYQSMAQLDADVRRALGNQEPEAVSSMLTQSTASDGSLSSPGASARTASGAVSAPRSTASTVIIIAGILAAIGLVAGALYLKKRLNGDPAPAATTSVATAPAAPSAPVETSADPVDTNAPATPTTTTTGATSAATPAPSASSASASAHVVLKVIPATAKLTVDGDALEKPELDVDPARPRSLRVEAPGFVTQTVPIDGSQREVTVALVRQVIAPPPPPPPSGTWKNPW